MKRHINGIDMAFEESGRGVPVLWVHGYPLHRGMWRPQVTELTDVGRHIAPDLRGFGESDAPDGTYSMDLYADDLSGLLDALSIEQAVIAGLSMGGYIAMAFARNHPRRLRALVLADTRAGADSPESAQTRRESAERALREGVRVVVEPLVETLLSKTTQRERPELVEQVRAMMLAARPAGVAGALRGMAARRNSTMELASISVPMLALVGADDTLTPPAESAAIASRIRGARLATIEQAGHIPNLEQPENFNAEVRAFLQSL